MLSSKLKAFYTKRYRLQSIVRQGIMHLVMSRDGISVNQLTDISFFFFNYNVLDIGIG